MKNNLKNTKFLNFKKKADNIIDNNRKTIIMLILAFIFLFVTCFISNILGTLLITFF